MFDINKATIGECKELAYDTLAQIEQLQRQLQALNKAIADKGQEVKEVKEKTK